MSKPLDDALEHFEKIDNSRRHLDSITHERKQRMEDNITTVIRKLYDDNPDITLREFLGNLDLHFNSEEYIEQDIISVTPELIATGVYLDMLPDMLTAGESSEIHRKYIEPYSKITEDEYFMVTEYIQEYY